MIFTFGFQNVEKSFTHFDKLVIYRRSIKNKRHMFLYKCFHL